MTPTVALKHVPAVVAWSESTLVSEVLNIDLLTELPKLMDVEYNFSHNLFYAWVMRVVLRFDLTRDAQKFLLEEHTWNKWFKCLRKGMFDEPNLERLAWVKIMGVPIALRAEENYTIITNVYRKTLQFEGWNWHNLDLSYGTTCILTSTLTRINDVTVCTFNNKTYHVG